MYEIAVCEDINIVAEKLIDIITEILRKKCLENTITVFHNGRELVECNSEFDIIFLDIDMPDMDGIEAGKILRQRGATCHIVMATGVTDRINEAFMIEAIRFVSKPFDKKEIEEAIETIEKRTLGAKKIMCYSERNEYEVMQNKIPYIEAFNGCIRFRVNGREYRKVISLDKMSQETDKRIFYKVHKAYIVNMMYIDDYSDGIIYMCDRQITVSKRLRKDFEKAYVEYDIKYR